MKFILAPLALACLLSACQPTTTQSNATQSSSAQTNTQHATQNSNSSATTTTSTTTTNSTTHAMSSPKFDDNDRQALADTLQKNFIQSGIDARIQGIEPAPIDGWYRVALEGMAPVLIDATGTHIMQGTLLAFNDGRYQDASAQMARQDAVNTLSKIPAEQTIDFAAKDHKATIYVFSDITCHYCQKLHQEIDDINAGGVTVRYFAWPRSESAVKPMQNVWCAADRRQALTDAKRGKYAPDATCDDPVRAHMALGYSLGVSGTPAVFAENGEQIGGYLPADDMVKLAIANKAS